MYDIIGHIGGNAPALERLLSLLGHRAPSPSDRTSSAGSSSRRIIFLGQLGGGAGARRCYHLARSFVDAGVGLWVLTPSELNAVVRKQLEPTTQPAKAAVDQDQWSSFLTPQEFAEATDWFESLPVWVQLPGLHVVHGLWDDERIRLLASYLPGRRLTWDIFADTSPRGDVIREALSLCTGASTTAVSPVNPSATTTPRSPASLPLCTARRPASVETIIDPQTNSCSLGRLSEHDRTVRCYRWSGEQKLIATNLLEIR